LFRLTAFESEYGFSIFENCAKRQLFATHSLAIPCRLLLKLLTDNPKPILYFAKIAGAKYLHPGNKLVLKEQQRAIRAVSASPFDNHAIKETARGREEGQNGNRSKTDLASRHRSTPRQAFHL
jgi:hypothetical protein